MSDTPRTDAVVAPYIGSDTVTVEECSALLDVARQLERELAAAQRQVADLMAELDREIQAKHLLPLHHRPLLAKLGEMSAELAAKDARIRMLENESDAARSRVSAMPPEAREDLGRRAILIMQAKETRP
jgi:regulator of replication initiation timing